jgi:glucosylglycerate phosphorylase
LLSSTKNRIKQHLLALYNEQTADQSLIKILTLINDFQNKYSEQQTQSAPLTADDVVLITYGDQFSETPHKPLHTLDQFLKNIVLGTINTVHILPFFPYTSDDGFSVVDYTMIDPVLGDWGDIARLKQNFSLMFDFVLNHISRDSEWFQEYLRGNPNYDKFFITLPSTTDLAQVVRPRALPLLTPVETQDGVKRVWTTFSEDQIDLNFANPEVLLRMISILLFYVSKGADLIRLDAIAYLWKEVGTSCIHLPQTHHVVKLFRAVLDAAAPNVRLITETNVPHQENISYFGSALVNEQDQIVGGDEAQLVYQFPLAPLLLHTLRVEDTHLLNQWLQTLQLPFPGVTFFNFLASHDGIGIRPAEQILTGPQIQALIQQTKDHGGQVSYKHNADGTRAPYELNITLYDMVNEPASRDTPTGIDRFIATQAVMLSLAGLPGIYIHSLFGSSNCVDCVQETGRARSINRQKFDFSSDHEPTCRS